MFGAEHPLEICIDHHSRSSRNTVGSRSVSSFLMDSTQLLQPRSVQLFKVSFLSTLLQLGFSISKLHSEACRVFRGVPQADFRFLW